MQSVESVEVEVEGVGEEGSDEYLTASENFHHPHSPTPSRIFSVCPSTMDGELSSSGPIPVSSNETIQSNNNLSSSSNGYSARQGVHEEILEECGGPRRRQKLAAFLLRYPSLLSLALVLLLPHPHHHYHTTLLILTVVVSVGGWVELWGLEWSGGSSLWVLYQVNKALLLHNLSLLSLASALTVFAALPLNVLQHQGLLSNSTNVLYLMLCMSSLSQAFLSTYTLIKSYHTYKVLHTYKVAGMLRHLSTVGHHPPTSRPKSHRPTEGVDDRIRRYHRDLFIEDLANKSLIVHHLRSYGISSLILKFLAMVQIASTALALSCNEKEKEKLVGSHILFLASVSLSFGSGTLLFLLNISPILTNVAIRVKEMMKSRLKLRIVMCILHVGTAGIFIYTVVVAYKDVDLLQYRLTLFFSGIVLCSGLSFVLLIIQIDTIGYLSKSIEKDLYQYYTSSSDCVSF